MDIKAKRDVIDKIDNEIIALLAKRFTLAEAIAAEKQKNGVALSDASREAEIIKKAAATLGKDGAATVYGAILEESRRRQKESL